MFRSDQSKQKSGGETDLLTAITAILPVWNKYSEQLIKAELKNESDKFPLTKAEKIYLHAYQKQLLGTFFTALNTKTKNDEEETYLVIAESNDYARNGLSRSLFCMLEKMGCDRHHMMEKDYRAIYIKSETAKQKLQQLIIKLLDIEIAVPHLIETWKKYADIRFEYEDECIMIFSDDKNTRQQFCQDIEKTFGFSIELPEVSTRISKTHSAILVPYLENVISTFDKNQKLDDDTKKLIQAKKEKALKFLTTAREKFHQNMATTRASSSQVKLG